MAGDGINAWSAVQPKGLALAILCCTIIFSVVTTLVISMRLFIRVKTRNYGIDDIVMLIGYLINMGQYIIVIYGAYTGIGTKDDRLDDATSKEGYKAVLFWQVFYAVCLVFIKSSICITILRIAQNNIHIYILRGLIILSAGLSIVSFVIILNQCHPLARFWDHTLPGTCWSPVTAIGLSYGASVSNVITDLTVAILPFFLLHDLQMRSRLKLYLHLILGLGIITGCVSIIRIPFTDAYIKPRDKLYFVGNIVLWTVIECGLCITFGSLPMLRACFKHLAKDESTDRGYAHSGDAELVTIGRVRGRFDGSRVLTEAQAVDVDERDADDDSTRHIIKMTRTVQQTESKTTGNK